MYKLEIIINKDNRFQCGKECPYLKIYKNDFICSLFSKILRKSFLNKKNALRCKDCKKVMKIYEEDEKKGI